MFIICLFRRSIFITVTYHRLLYKGNYYQVISFHRQLCNIFVYCFFSLHVPLRQTNNANVLYTDAGVAHMVIQTSYLHFATLNDFDFVAFVAAVHGSVTIRINTHSHLPEVLGQEHLNLEKRIDSVTLKANVWVGRNKDFKNCTFTTIKWIPSALPLPRM